MHRGLVVVVVVSIVGAVSRAVSHIHQVLSLFDDSGFGFGTSVALNVLSLMYIDIIVTKLETTWY